MQWRDNDKAVELTSNLEQRAVNSEDERYNAQFSIYQYLQAKA
jgi:hypothetical protein